MSLSNRSSRSNNERTRSNDVVGDHRPRSHGKSASVISMAPSVSARCINVHVSPTATHQDCPTAARRRTPNGSSALPDLLLRSVGVWRLSLHLIPGGLVFPVLP